MKKTNESKHCFAGILGPASVMMAAAMLVNYSSPTPVQAAESDVTLNVWVANYAKVPKRELSRAERIAGGAFLDAGIGMMWLDMPLERMHLDHLDPKYDVRPGDIHLTILRRSAFGTFSAQELGFAIPCPESKVGCLAYISYSLIEELASNVDVFKSDILGAAMEHEIGHILLGAGHSLRGVMKPHWNERDLQEIAWHRLKFTPDEGKNLHSAAVLMQAEINRTRGKRHLRIRLADDQPASEFGLALP